MNKRADLLVHEFITRWEAGDDVDLAEVLARARRDERRAVQERIESFLTEASTSEVDVAAFEAFAADPERQALLDRALDAQPQSLLALRQAAQLKREVVVRELTKALEVPDSEWRIDEHYHALEAGTVSPLRVSERVWQTLSRLFGEQIDRVRDAAMGAFDPDLLRGSAAFARTAAGTADPGSEPLVFYSLAPDSEPTEDPADAAFFDDPE